MHDLFVQSLACDNLYRFWASNISILSLANPSRSGDGWGLNSRRRLFGNCSSRKRDCATLLVIHDFEESSADFVESVDICHRHGLPNVNNQQSAYTNNPSLIQADMKPSRDLDYGLRVGVWIQRANLEAGSWQANPGSTLDIQTFLTAFFVLL